MPRFVTRFLDMALNVGLAIAAGLLATTFLQSTTGPGLPGWFPFGVVLGVLFVDPMSVLRHRLVPARALGRFFIGQCMAYLMFTAMMMVIRGDSGHFFLVLLMPVVVLPLFMGYLARSKQQETDAPDSAAGAESVDA